MQRRNTKIRIRFLTFIEDKIDEIWTIKVFARVRDCKSIVKERSSTPVRKPEMTTTLGRRNLVEKFSLLVEIVLNKQRHAI